MRRKSGTLLPIELSILGAALGLSRQGQAEFHGYAIAKEMREREAARKLAAQGTLYRALDRLEALGFLEGRLEEPEVAAAESRPRRHLYRVSALGERAYSEAGVRQRTMSGNLREGTASA
jgi:PadR family transcriptional regulator, regulatory protein PadR